MPATLRRCCCGPAACSRSCSSPGSARWPSIPGRTVAVELQPRLERHRQHRDARRPRQSRVLSSDYGTGAAMLEVQGRRATSRAPGGVFHARNAQPPLFVCARRRARSTAFPAASSRRSISTPVSWRGAIAAWEKARSSTPISACICTAKTAWSGSRKRSRPPIVSADGSRFPRAAPTWSHPIITNGRLILRDQDKIYAYDVLPASIDDCRLAMGNHQWTPSFSLRPTVPRRAARCPSAACR